MTVNIPQILTTYNKLEKLETFSIACTNISNLSFLDKNKNIKVLEMWRCKKIKDFTPISKLEKNKNIQEINLNFCKNIKKFSHLFNSDLLEVLNVGKQKFLIFHSEKKK